MTEEAKLVATRSRRINMSEPIYKIVAEPREMTEARQELQQARKQLATIIERELLEELEQAKAQLAAIIAREGRREWLSYG